MYGLSPTAEPRGITILTVYEYTKKRPNTVAFLMVLVEANRGFAKPQFATA
jgi:hypothetical protein